MGQIQLTFGVLVAVFCAVHAYRRYGYSSDFCPRGFTQYSGFNSRGTTCPRHCNISKACPAGEVCCIEELGRDYEGWSLSDEKCATCMKPDFGCYDENSGRYHKDGEMFIEEYGDYYHDKCSVCQCLRKEVKCMDICDHSIWKNNWVSAGITAGVALFISVVFTLCLCCCLTCSCKIKRRNVVSHPPPAMKKQEVGDFYAAPQHEEKVPLTSCEEA